MQAPGTPSVDQLLVLLAVVDEGSFTGAARRLRRATSAITYAIDALEAQLGLALFDQGRTRNPKLTPAGEAIVSEAKAVAHSVETVRARVRGLLAGLEEQVMLSVQAVQPRAHVGQRHVARACPGPRPIGSVGSACARRRRLRGGQSDDLAGR